MLTEPHLESQQLYSMPGWVFLVVFTGCNQISWLLQQSRCVFVVSYFLIFGVVVSVGFGESSWLDVVGMILWLLICCFCLWEPVVGGLDWFEFGLNPWFLWVNWFTTPKHLQTTDSAPKRQPN